MLKRDRVPCPHCLRTRTTGPRHHCQHRPQNRCVPPLSAMSTDASARPESTRSVEPAASKRAAHTRTTCRRQTSLRQQNGWRVQSRAAGGEAGRVAGGEASRETGGEGTRDDANPAAPSSADLPYITSGQCRPGTRLDNPFFSFRSRPLRHRQTLVEGTHQSAVAGRPISHH